METLVEDINENEDPPEFIEIDSVFDNIMSYNMNVEFEDKLMKRVYNKLEEKDRKISELEEEILDIKTQQTKLKNIINYIVKDYHYDRSGIKNIQIIYDKNGNMMESVINEGWTERRIPILTKENGSLKRYKLDGKIYDINENGGIVEITRPKI